MGGRNGYPGRRRHELVFLDSGFSFIGHGWFGCLCRDIVVEV
jgi:hypothetical protein